MTNQFSPNQAAERAEPRWRRLPGERPRQIISAAFEVFGERGLAAARLDDIAKRAGVSKGTIYLYFPNKEALFVEMIHDKVISEIEAAELEYAEGDPRLQLRRFYERVWRMLRGPVFGVTHRLVMHEIQSFPDLAAWWIKAVAERAMRLSASIIRRGVDRGDFRSTDPEVAARMAHAVFVQNAVWAANRKSLGHLVDPDDDRNFQLMLDFIFHALDAHHDHHSEPDATGAGSHE